MANTHPLFKDVDKVNVEKLKKDFENKNGNKLKDFSIKEIVLMFHKNTKEDMQTCNDSIMQLEQKLDKHIEWGEHNMDMGNKFIREHDRIIQRITDNLTHITTELPEKGFCEKTNKTLYTEDGIDKVEILWNDRRWIKNLLYAAIALTTILGGGNILIALFG